MLLNGWELKILISQYSRSVDNFRQITLLIGILSFADDIKLSPGEETPRPEHTGALKRSYF